VKRIFLAGFAQNERKLANEMFRYMSRNGGFINCTVHGDLRMSHRDLRMRSSAKDGIESAGHQQAAIDGNGLAGNETRAVADQEGKHRREIGIGVTELATERNDAGHHGVVTI